MTDIHDALGPVLRDVLATTDVTLSLEEDTWTNDLGPCAAVSTADGRGGAHIQLQSWDDPAERIASAASQVQDVVIEELWARASNWPMCPAHRNNHPMEACVANGVASWVCPADGRVVAEIGALRL